MGLVMEALADGGVLVGIPRPMADKIAAYTMMVRREGERKGKDVLHSSFSLEHSKDGDREENQTARSKPLLPTSVTRPVASQIRTSVASPGGTTIHGLKVMEDSGVRGALMGAILRGTERAKELRPSE